MKDEYITKFNFPDDTFPRETQLKHENIWNEKNAEILKMLGEKKF